MLNPNELTVTLNPTRRWLRIVLFLVITVYGVWRLYEGITYKHTPTMLMGAALLFLSLFMIYQLWSYRLTVTESYVETRGMSSKRVLYSDIVQAREHRGQLLLYGSSDTIRIMSDIDHRDEVTAKLASKLNALPVLRLTGRTNAWGLHDRDDEGRPVHRG